jgi:DNA-binding LytR/AlgR family response regulator
MRILLADDEPLALGRMQVALDAVPNVQVVGTAADGVEAAERIAELTPDLAILDIQMPGMSGMELAQTLAESARRPQIVFVTAFGQFALDAFEVDAADYLLKPVSFDRLRLAVERVRRRLTFFEAGERAAGLSTEVAPHRSNGALLLPDTGSQVYEPAIWVPSRHGAVRVPVQSIDRIEAARDYVLLNTSLKTYILRITMNELERRVDPRVMVRIHRSHMVRIESVVGIERPGKGVLRVLLSDGANLQVGPNYQERVTRALCL